MTYKNNIFYLNYSKKYKDIEEYIKVLEKFCVINNIKMNLYGSITRFDFYYKKSDIDILFITNNIYTIFKKLINFLLSNKDIKIKYITNCYYYYTKDKIEFHGILVTYYINELEFQIIIINENDYTTWYDITISKLNILKIILFVIIKFFYYQMHIIDKKTYKFLKKKIYTSNMITNNSINIHII